MLCLITKGVHLEGRGKRSDAPGTARVNAYKTFATQLNDAVNGKNYGADIPIKEIIKKLDELLEDHKTVLGKNGLVERQSLGHVTRTMTLAFERATNSAYNGKLRQLKENSMGPYEYMEEGKGNSKVPTPETLAWFNTNIICSRCEPTTSFRSSPQTSLITY